MKINRFAILLASLVFALGVRAADQPPLNEHLKQFEWNLGRWEGTAKDATYGELRLVEEIKADLGGSVISIRYELFDKEGRSGESGILFYQWREEANAVGSISVGNNGHGSGLLVKQSENKWIWQDSGYDRQGKLSSGLTEVTRNDADTLTLRFTQQSLGGEPRPDFQITLKRVTSSLEDEIIKLENAWNDALVKADAQTLDKLMADEWSEVDSDAKINSKKDSLDNTKSGRVTFTSAVLDQAKTKVFGDTVVVTARNTIKATEGGKDTSGQYRFTDTWIKRDGRWQCVATHGTKIP